MVKGNAGSGKTILSLSILEDIGNVDNAFYLSTRVTNEALYSQFEWLQEKDWRDNLIDASVDFLKSISEEAPVPQEFKRRKEDQLERLDKARKVLIEMREKEGVEEELPEQVSRSMLLDLQDDQRVQEIEDLYNRIEDRLPEPSLVVIDSIEAIIERYGFDAIKFIKALQKDLVEWSGVRLIIVSEKSEYTQWDYLVDGVITLNEEEQDGRRLRYLYLNKLRGVRIERPIYLFSLNEGRFRYFPPLEYQATGVGFRPQGQVIDDGEDTEFHEKGFFSTGSKELDEILKGGYPRDSFLLLEVGDNVPFSGEMNVVGPVSQNFLEQGRGVLNISAEGKKSDRRSISRYLKDIAPEDNKEGVLDLPIKAATTLEDISDAYKEVKFQAEEPILTIADWEDVEHSIAKKDEEITAFANRFLDMMMSYSRLNICIVRPGLKLTQKLRNIAEVHLKLLTKHNTLLMYGEKPKTMVYNNVNIESKEEEGVERKIEFTPLV